MTTERKLEILNNLLGWIGEHDEEFMECAFAAAKVTPAEAFELGFDSEDYSSDITIKAFDIEYDFGVDEPDEEPPKEMWLELYISDEDDLGWVVPDTISQITGWRVVNCNYMIED